MKIYDFKNLERAVIEKAAHLEKQRELVKFERVRLKRAWIETLTSPSALLLSLSAGFVAGYFRKARGHGIKETHGRAAKVRANLQSAITSAIKRFSSGVLVGIISSISSRRSSLQGPPPEEYSLTE